MIPVPALFLHIQKTAGTAVVRTVSGYYEKVVSHLDYHGCRPDDLDRTDFVSGHFGYGFARELMPSRYCFTFLRDPVERVLSFYYHCRRSDPGQYPVYRLAREKSLDEFLDLALEQPQVMSYVWNHQTWQLACGWGNRDGRYIVDYDPEQMITDARDHLAEFDYIGFTETLDRDMAVILERLKITLSAGIPRINAGGARPRPEDLPSSTRSRLRRITEMDQMLVDHARSLRRSRGR
ncbi:MAG: sulfotransferase family 2 domain-containing protein [Thermodesulfobacteriota bacterium]